jgi:outer membrane lipopolysaccharide assembly protein LptE/RlpB
LVFHKRVATVLIVFFVATFFYACGYKFVGSGSLPSGIKRIHVAMLENHSADTGVENVLTNDLIYEFVRSGDAVVSDRESADAVLTGKIVSISSGAIAHTTTDVSSQRRVTVRVDLQLIDSHGEVVWQRDGFSAEEAYEVAVNKLDTEQNRKDAIGILSKRLAEKIYGGLTEDF